MSNEPLDLSQAVAVRKGVHLLDAKTLGHDLRADQAAREAWGFVMEWRCPLLLYDSIGVGAGAASAFRTIAEKRAEENLPPGPDCEGWAGAAGVIDPDHEFVSGRTNAEFFATLKSQAWWHLRMRFLNTYRAVNGDDTINLDDIVSLDSEIAELGQLKSELAQITYKHNSAGKVPFRVSN